jgi:thiol-disulfide isomerase/thioredoxin
MQKPKTQRPMIIGGALVALIIIGIAIVASRPTPQAPTQTAETVAEKPADSAAVAPTDAAHADTIELYDTPRPAPTTVFKDAEDADVTLAKFSGKVLVVNFWATWCAPCVKEMPTLDALEAKLGGPAFEVVAIAQDREGAKVAKPFAEKNQWKNLDFYTEAGGKFMRESRLNGLPTSLIIDKSGQEVGRVEGELDWASPGVEQVLRDLMAQN